LCTTHRLYPLLFFRQKQLHPTESLLLYPSSIKGHAQQIKLQATEQQEVTEQQDPSKEPASQSSQVLQTLSTSIFYTWFHQQI